jgi:polysaccharide export outer membrane protein
MMISKLVSKAASVSQLSLMIAFLAVGCLPGPPNLPVPSNSGSSSTLPTSEINRLLAAAASTEGPVASDDYRLGPEDMVQITVFNIAGGEGGGLTPRDVTVRVSQQGIVTLPLLGDIKVSGLTVAELQKLLRERYDKFVYDPEVGVMVRDFRSQRVYLLGAINRAGAIDLTGPKTLIDVLAMAGGVGPKAGNQVHIYRQTPDGRKSYIIDLFALTNSIGFINDKTVEAVNLAVQTGDIINVPEAGTFFVDGAVGRAGSFTLGRRYTLTQAIALAGGTNHDLADYSNVTIYRTVDNEVKQIHVDLNAIRDGTQPDFVMQNDDFLFVPISGLKWVWNFYLKQAINMPNMVPSIPWMAGS